MDAEETKFFTLPVGKGKDRRLQIESRKTANWSARQNGLDMAFKIRGLYVREQENKGPEFSVITINRAYRPDWSAMRRDVKSSVFATLGFQQFQPWIFGSYSRAVDRDFATSTQLAYGGAPKGNLSGNANKPGLSRVYSDPCGHLAI